VVSFFRSGSTELAETVRAGSAADQLVLALIGFALSAISPASAEPLLFRSVQG
jgi:hypothetical protein